MVAGITNSAASPGSTSPTCLDRYHITSSSPHSDGGGLNHEATEVICRLYDNRTTMRGNTGPTPEINIRAGVKQGCPLSPIIFNLIMEPILNVVSQTDNGYQLHQENKHTLACADDLELVAWTPDDLQRLLDETGQVADWAGLRFSTKK
jgi:hypothetical protein